MNIVKLWEKNDIILDSGFFFGMGVFETIKINDNPIFLKEHIKRLNKGLMELNINNNIDEKIVEDIIKKENLKNIALKVSVSEKNIIFSTRKINYTNENYKKGFKINLSNIRRNSTSNLNNVKSLNYTENIIEKEKSKLLGFDEPIFINERNELCEGATTNIFLVKNNIIKTPKVKCGLLDGIIRKYLMKNFNIEECILTIEDLKNSDEIILTNSLLELIWVSEFEERKYKRGPIYNELRSKYEEHVRVNWREI